MIAAPYVYAATSVDGYVLCTVVTDSADLEVLYPLVPATVTRTVNMAEMYEYTSNFATPATFF